VLEGEVEVVVDIVAVDTVDRAVAGITSVVYVVCVDVMVVVEAKYLEQNGSVSWRKNSIMSTMTLLHEAWTLEVQITVGRIVSKKR
jgi:hypothetical protein